MLVETFATEIVDTESRLTAYTAWVPERYLPHALLPTERYQPGISEEERFAMELRRVDPDLTLYVQRYVHTVDDLRGNLTEIIRNNERYNSTNDESLRSFVDYVAFGEVTLHEASDLGLTDTLPREASPPPRRAACPLASSPARPVPRRPHRGA
jgi:hypothetical protein